ncbi:neuropeptide F isoform 1-T6 [Glossina fuscipes fuscipes]
MAYTLRRVLVLLTILSLFNAKVFGKNTRPTRNDEIANIEEALQYLQELENFYDGKARIRFGKRSYLMQMLKNRLGEAGEMVIESRSQLGRLFPIGLISP